jgi:anti-anti-sigma factor
MSAGFSLTTIHGVPVVSTPPEIDITNAGELRAALRSAAGNGHTMTVADMNQTAFCDTAALGVLVRAHRQAAAEGAELRLVIRSRSLLRIFSITGVDSVIPAYPTLAEALSERPTAAIRPQRPDLRAEALARAIADT